MSNRSFAFYSVSGGMFRPPPPPKTFLFYGPQRRKRTTFRQACHAVWACGIMGWTQAQAAAVLGLHPSTVNAILHGRLFAAAYPIPLVVFRGRASANDNQHSFDF